MSRVLIILILAPLTVFAQAVIYDSRGFEPSRFTVGGLEGQDAGVSVWSRAVGPISGTGNVQSTTVAYGTQAVRLLRTTQDVRYVTLTPHVGASTSVTPIVSVDWYMNFAPAGLPGGSFGPFVGVEVIDNIGNFPQVAASLGVDATTGQLLYQAPGSGTLNAVPSINVSSNVWHSYRLELDYVSMSYRVLLDGVQVFTNNFVDGGIADFAYANLANIAAAEDAVSLNATGTVYYDNFRITRSSRTNAPSLRIDRADGQRVHISWAPHFPGWILQESLTMRTNTWANSPSGPTNLLTILTPATNKFYRLSKP